MKKWVLGICVVGVVASYSLPSTAATSVTPAQQQVLRVDNEWAEAENRRDSGTLRRVLDDQFIAVYGSGKIVGKEQFIKDVIGDSNGTIESQDLSDVTVLVDGDTAVVSETDTAHGTEDGHPYINVVRVTTTYIKRHGRWVALAERFGRAVDLTADEAAIRKADAEWVKAAQSKKAEAWLAFYTDEAVILPPNDKIAHGKESARKSVAELLALPGLAITWAATKVEVARSGDLAYLTGAYVLSFKDERGQPVTDRGKLLEIWSKQRDGVWKCSADTWNSDLPSVGTPST